MANMAYEMTLDAFTPTINLSFFLCHQTFETLQVFLRTNFELAWLLIRPYNHMLITFCSLKLQMTSSTADIYPGKCLLKERLQMNLRTP